MRTSVFKSGLLQAGAAVALLVGSCGPAMADSTVTLVAAPSSALQPDGRNVPMWGYTCGDSLQTPVLTTGGTCLAATGAPQNGVSWQPPVITVPAGKLTITLVNQLAGTGAANIPTSIIIDGQNGGGLGITRTTSPSPVHGPQGTTWPGTLGMTDTKGITAINVVVPGQGYVSPPTITIDGGGWSGATATATLTGGAVTGITVFNGNGYLSQPTVTISPPPCAINATDCIAATATAVVDTSSTGNTDNATFRPPTQADRVRSLATEVTTGNTAPLVWANLRPGTYLLHSGTETSIQHTMGLYAVLVVTDPAGATTAYGTTFDKDVALLLSEIDPEFNDAVNLAVNTAGFDARAVWNGQPGFCGDPAVHSCYPPIVNYSPLYYLINGVAFDRTNIANSSFAVPPAVAASTGKLLLRFVNAGLRLHVPSVVGASMTLVAEDGNKLPASGTRIQDSVLLTAGKTYDVTIKPTSSAGAYAAATYPVFDRQLSLSTGNQRDGGMQAYLSVNGGAAAGAVGSASSSTSVTTATKGYTCIAGQPLAVTNPALGLLGGSTGVSGVALGPIFGGDLSASTLRLQSNGTFTYTPSTATSCGGSFQYLPNGVLANAQTVTITECDSHLSTGCTLAAAPTVADVQFTSKVATLYTSSPPGVLGTNVANPGGLKLSAVAVGTAAGGTVTLNDDGSFVATPGAGVACPLGSVPGSTCMTFGFNARNSQGTLAQNAATATVVFNPPSNLTVKVVDAKDPTKPISDYRWLIEEDRTFWVDPKCQINSTNTTDPTKPAYRPASCPPLPVESLGYNFHSANMPVIAQGCVGKASCEDAQMVYDPASNSHVPAACDIGDGVCRTGATQKTPLLPSSVYLDPTKRYFLSILPGDSVNPTIGGPGSMPVDPANPGGAQRQFDIVKDCGVYTGPTGAWEPAGPAAMCGHGMGGAQISKELVAAGNPSVTVKLQETPLPTAKISVLVYQDDNPLNGENDAGGGVDVIAPNEAGLGGFEIKLFDQAGQLGDNTGQITYDEFNQPVSNALADTIDPITKKNACPISKRGDGLVGMIPTCPKYEDDGVTPSPLAGQAVIANLYPGLYEIQAFPAADRIGRGEEWLQTNTLDGGKPHEAFIKPNEPGYFQEFGPGGFHVSIGFANPKIINQRLAEYCGSALNGGGTGAQTCDKTLTVHVTNNHMSRSPDQRTYSSETYDHFAFSNCYVSVGPADGADFAFAKCDANGTAVFNNIPNGTYKISVFDQWNDIMLDGLVGTVSVSGNTEKIFPVTQWRTNLYTRTFIDGNGDGVSQEDELGLALVNTNIRYRDGSFAFFNNTDLNGYAAWNEVFPFMNWLVVETSTTRYKPMGVHSVYDAGGPVDCSAQATFVNPNCATGSITANLANSDVRVPLPDDLRLPGAVYCDDADCAAQNLLTQALTVPVPFHGLSTAMISPPQPFGTTVGWQGLLGQNTFMEFPVKPFSPGENGGISGQVVYASTRPFDDPSLSLQLSWEPGVPHVKINLYSETVDASGNTKLTLVDTTMSASFDDWAQGFRTKSDGTLLKAADGNYVPNMNCPGQDAGSPFFATLKNSKMWLDTTDASGNKKPLAYQSQFKCYDGWSQLNQAQPAPYDGKYKFPSVTTVDANGKPAGTNCTGCVTNTFAAPGDWDYQKPMLPAGKYVVEVVLPPGYELVKEEDKNILLGDVYVAPVTQQFAGFGNIFIMPDQATINSAYNQNNPGNLNLTSNLGSVTFPRHEGDTGSIEAYWPCVGTERIVPDLNSLYPQAGQAAPFAGAKRRLCDRKEVQVDDQSSVLAKFFVFSSTHIAGHFTGTITNDFASEFDPFSPQFGEKFGPPNLPVGLRDFTGNEVARVYSDQWGIYNGLFYSTWTVNPPNPTGYAPQMSVACMNDPGPILAADGVTQITDPSYNPAYSNFCYEQPFMPGTTTYMDTPVIPTQAFADGYNLPDTEYPDGTPAILKVTTDSTSYGPWVDTVPPVASVNVVNRGAGYTAVPSVSFTGGGGSGATATATMRVASVALTSAGSGYTNVLQPNNGIAVTGGGGTGAAVLVSGLRVASVSFTQTPAGTCTGTSHAVTFTGAVATSGAAATATIAAGKLTAINVTNGGNFLLGIPTVTVANCSGLTNVAKMGVGNITVVAAGSGYLTQPTVTFGAPPVLAGNTTATGNGLLSVNAVAVTAGGSGYSSAPTVVFTGTSTTVATATAVLGSGDGTGVTLTINALGDKVVQNPNFSGPNATSAPYNQKTITRHYTFGGSGTVALVGADGVPHPLTDVVWGDMTITGKVPSGVPLCNVSNKSYTGSNAGARCGELVITRADNGKQSIDAVTVTIGGTKPWVVSPIAVTNASGGTVGDNGAAFGRMGFSPLQLAIDQANPGDLILVQPGTYKENLIMWKPVRLQGVGASLVTINADAHPAGKMDQWRRQINCVFGLDLNGVPNPGNVATQYDPTGAYSCPAGMHQRVDRIPFEAIVGWDASGNGNLAQVLQEPTLMGSYEGAGITVLGRGVRAPACNDATFGANCNDFWGQNATGGAGAFTDGSVYLGNSANDCKSSTTQVDGRDYGTSNFYCNPSRIDGISVINSSQGGGALFVHGWAQNLEIANTRIVGNQGTLAGAINLGNGETPDAFINDGVECGPALTGAAAVVPCPPIPTGTATGAAIPFQFNTNVRIHHNMLYNNASIGDALFSGTPAGAGGITVSAGADAYRIDHNWIAGNLSTGDGGGVQHLGLAFNGKIDHNYVLYNQSTNPTLPTNGGGVVVEGATLDRQLNGTECGSTSDQDCPPGLGEGVGPGLVIDANLIMGNSAESGSGGGLRLQQINGSADLIAFPTQTGRWYDVTVTNNIIANNVAGYDGGGVSVQDALKVKMVNNTVASNDTTASAGALFKTLGAIMSNTPPPGCTPTTDPTLPQNPNCLVADAPHGPQPSGLVVSAHTVNLVDALVGVSTDCSALGTDYGYVGTGAGNDCRKVSKPNMVNNLFWQNRTFSVNVVDGNGNVVVGTTTPTGSGLQSQQNLIALTPALVQKATGDCPAGANVWDIGLRTDDVNGGTIPPGTRLTLVNSLYTGDAKTATLIGTAGSVNNQTPSASPLVAAFCNGARMPPEHCTDGGVDNGSASCKGYNAPVGASETTGLTQAFVFNGIQPTATVDEGHNWLNLTYGPLTLSRPNVATATPGEVMLVPGVSGLGTTLGAYSIARGTAAVGNGSTASGLPGTVAADFFGNPRVTSPGAKLDIGAVALTTTTASVRPTAVAFGSVAVGASSTRTITLAVGTAALSGITVTTTAPFSRPSGAAGGTCTAALSLATATCTINIVFTPSAAGPVTGSVTVESPVGTSVTGAPVALTGNGVLVNLNPSPSSLLFSQVVNTSSAVQTVTVTNIGTVQVTGAYAAVTGTGFTRASGASAGNCGVLATPTTLNPGQTCTVGVVFAPVTAGSASGLVSIGVATGFSVGAPVTLIGNATPLPPTLSSLTPTSVARNATRQVTLTGTNLTGAMAVNVSGTGVTVPTFTVTNDTTIVATVSATAGAATGTRNVSVVTAGGTSGNATLTVVTPPAPTVTGVSPTSGARGTAVTVTLTGTSLDSTSNVTVSGSRVAVSGMNVIDASHVSAVLTIQGNAAIGLRTIRVTNPGGQSAAVNNFTVN